jgi:hypothetical protein
MPQRKIDSLSSDGAQLVASLLARIDGLMVQIAARDNRIDELLAQVMTWPEPPVMSNVFISPCRLTWLVASSSHGSKAEPV